MYTVIFTADIARLDEEYSATAARMRQLALERYGCKAFNACTEGGKEIAVSYWDNEEQIRAWKRDPEHLAAQEKGRKVWYSSYSVDVARIVRGYAA